MSALKSAGKRASIRDLYNWTIKNVKLLFEDVHGEFGSESKIHPRLLWSANRIAAHVIISSSEDADSWMYLFSDLSCVAVFYKACLVILECGSHHANLASVGVMFFIIFSSRLAFDDYSNRFTAKYNRLMCFVFAIGMFLMALNATAFKISAHDAAVRKRFIITLYYCYVVYFVYRA